VVLSEPYPTLCRNVRRIAEILEPFKFDALYGGFPVESVDANGKQVVAASAWVWIRTGISCYSLRHFFNVGGSSLDMPT
jgi:hypothetical protein